MPLAALMLALAALEPAPPVELPAVAALDPRLGKEISGVVQSRAHPGVLWAINDSGNKARLYPFRADGALIPPKDEHGGPGVHIHHATNVDWEDLAIDSASRLIIPDLGNNANDRKDLAIYLVPEPKPDEAEARAIKIPVRFPDQAAFPPPETDRTFDSEALFTVGDEIYILTKNRSDLFTKMYRLDSRDPDRANTLTYLDRFDAGGPVTAADASADGLRLAVLTHHQVWMFERSDTRRAFFAGRVLRREYKLEQGRSDCESVCFESPDVLLLASETHGRLYRFKTADLVEVRPEPAIPAGPIENDLRVMSFNLRYENTHDGPNNWSLRKPLVQQAISAFDPDLLGCQEVLASQADWLRETLKTHAFFGVGRLDGRREGEFAPILARSDRFLPLASGVFWLSDTPDEPGAKGWDAACERLATWARLRDLRTKKPLLVLNTHLDHVGVEARRKGLELIRARLAVLADGAPIVVTGDFNSSADGPDALRLIGADSTRPGVALVDTFRTLYPTRGRDEATFCDWRPTLAGDRIDWVLASPAFTVIDAAIDRRMTDGRTPSDHYPVTAILRPARETPVRTGVLTRERGR